MEVVVTRRPVDERGGLLREPRLSFVLTVTVSFSHEERWLIDAHHLYHHEIFDRTPPWYWTALRQAEHAKARAQHDGEDFEWPWHVPPTPPEEWRVSIARLIEDPTFTVSFDTAAELDHFERRLRQAFANFKTFLSSYGSRNETERWRW